MTDSYKADPLTPAQAWAITVGLLVVAAIIVVAAMLHLGLGLVILIAFVVSLVKFILWAQKVGGATVRKIVE